MDTGRQYGCEGSHGREAEVLQLFGVVEEGTDHLLPAHSKWEVGQGTHLGMHDTLEGLSIPKFWGHWARSSLKT